MSPQLHDQQDTSQLHVSKEEEIVHISETSTTPSYDDHHQGNQIPEDDECGEK